MRFAGEERLIAAEDAGRYRDALGAMPPGGLPETFLEGGAGLPPEPRRPVREGARPVHDRPRRTSTSGSTSSRVLRELERDERLVRGELRPGGTEREWCDPDVLRRLRRASLAALRKEVEPAEQAALGTLPAELAGDRPARDACARRSCRCRRSRSRSRSGRARCCRAASRTTGRVQLDQLCATGEVVWVGAGLDRVAVYFREDAPALGRPGRRRAAGGRGARPASRRRSGGGAEFWFDLLAATGLEAEQALPALWDLVWAGEVTNDAWTPLRAGRRYGVPKPERRPRRFSRRRSTGITATQGRWSLDRAALRAASPDRRALAELLLERQGIVTRDGVRAEGIAGGYGAVYGELKALETLGLCRRGYFVEGLGGAQFALGGAVERLRELRPQGGRGAGGARARGGRSGAAVRRGAAVAEAGGRPGRARGRRAGRPPRRRGGALRRARRPLARPAARARRGVAAARARCARRARAGAAAASDSRSSASTASPWPRREVMPLLRRGRLPRRARAEPSCAPERPSSDTEEGVPQRGLGERRRAGTSSRRRGSAAGGVVAVDERAAARRASACSQRAADLEREPFAFVRRRRAARTVVVTPKPEASRRSPAWIARAERPPARAIA